MTATIHTNCNVTNNQRGLFRAKRLHIPYQPPIEDDSPYHRDGWNAALEWVDLGRMWRVMDGIARSGLPQEEAWAEWVLSITPNETVPAFWTFLDADQQQMLKSPCLSFLAGFVDGLVAYCGARERERKRDRGESE